MRAPAAGEPAMSVEPFRARAELTVRSLSRSAHDGADGRIMVVRLRADGPMTSNDPRLEGTFDADAVIMVDERGHGASRNRWRIVDAATGRVKATGTSHGVHADPGPACAVAVGRLEDGSRLFAPARVTFPPPGTEGTIVVEYGGRGVQEALHRGAIVRGSVPPLVDRFAA